MPTALKRKDEPKIVGRDGVIESIFETLLRVEKPNVVLTGEPGVGKTAIVRYMRYLINEKLAPKGLLDYSIETVNLNDLLAGPGFRGSFEQRCKDEFRKYIGKDVIVFIDEFHAAENLGAMNEGKAPGFGNFLKPKVTDGKLRIIGATTNKEYEEMTDYALKRRFRRINIEEPGEEICKKIIEVKMESYNVDEIPVYDEKDLVDSIYTLSTSLPGFNPDKAVDISDILFAKSRLYGDEELDLETCQDYLEDIKLQREEIPDYERQ